MIGFSQTTGYAIQALSCLNDAKCHSRSLADIAECSSVPRPYLAKIANALARHRIITAKRGVGGGIALSRPPEKISLLEIVEAIEGAQWISDCLLNLRDCRGDGDRCPTRAFWHRVRGEITNELADTSLASVIARGASKPVRASCRKSSCRTTAAG